MAGNPQTAGIVKDVLVGLLRVLSVPSVYSQKMRWVRANSISYVSHLPRQLGPTHSRGLHGDAPYGIVPVW